MDELSRREREIALAYAEGASYRAIGEKLFIAPSTVRTHLTTIYRKTGVTSKLELARALNVLPEPDAGTAAPGERRRSLVVMPFALGAPDDRNLAAGLVQDVITRIAKLRSISVIARGTVFALDARGIRGREAAELLGADYVAGGAVTRFGPTVRISVELVDGSGDDILWSETYDCRADDTLLALDRIGDSIVTALAAVIEAAERSRAVLRNPQSLDAWESFHRGLWHMYRFTAIDNERAQEMFRRAVTLDPGFARAYSGLSFTHFQNAFLLRPEERQDEIARAMDTAGESLVADDRDPAAHWALGRALWLLGDVGAANDALSTSVDLSPNFAMGHYALSFVNSQSGDAGAAIRAADQSLALSPFDPLLFGFHGARAMALFRFGSYAEAADFAMKAVARPNAHVHIQAIAVHCLAAAGRIEEARRMVAAIRIDHPDYGSRNFLTAFRFPAADAAVLRQAAALAGLV
jgi:TolB-like protein/cytochrome c-type biogenesis protein CcmH/NrfG